MWEDVQTETVQDDDDAQRLVFPTAGITAVRNLAQSGHVATKEWVESAGYLTAHQSLSNYY